MYERRIERSSRKHSRTAVTLRIIKETSIFPRLTGWHVRKSLAWIDKAELAGLEYIRLMDSEPQDTAASEHPPYLVGFMYCGAYSKKKDGRPASISLYTRDLYFGIPRMLVTSPLATLSIASTLAHEIGHHVLVTRGHVEADSSEIKLNRLIDSPAERAATAYGQQTIKRMLVSPYFRAGKMMARALSNLLAKRGNQAHWAGDFKRAAELEFRAYMLDSDNTDAWQAYLQDRQLIVSKTPSELTDAERLWVFHGRNAVKKKRV
jgi:hypothetical protein